VSETLILFYSNTGNTRQAAQALADVLDADLAEITEPQPRQLDEDMPEGMDGQDIFKTAVQTLLGLGARINDLGTDPADYDLVVVGTPTWISSLSSPVRSCLRQIRGDLSQVAFFRTSKEEARTRVFRQMARAARRRPIAVAALTSAACQGDQIRTSMEAFAAEIRQARQS
jgi:flavodoxin